MKYDMEHEQTMAYSDAYMEMMRDIVTQGKMVSLILSGNSMSPFLVNRRDKVFLEKPTGRLKRGDIVFYQRDNGRYIMHRIYKIMDEEYYMIGDAQTIVEGPLNREQIFAVVNQCERKGKIITKGDFWWNFFEHVWIRIIPFRWPLVKLYNVIKIKK